MPQHVIEPFSSLVARVLRVWLFGLALSLFAAAVVSPCAAQPVSGAEAIDAMAQAMQARGLTPPPDSDLSLEDHITSRTTGGGDRAARHVGFWIGPDGYVIPDAEWRDARPNYCKRQARYLRAPTQLIDFEIHRNTEKADGVTRNQLWVFARVTDAETGTMTNASEGKATNMTGVQREDEGYVADALEMAFADMGGLNPKAPAGPCGEVRLEHVQGTDVGDPFVFRAGFRGFGKALVYTWDFGDGSAPAEGRSLQVPTHVYEKKGTYEVSVRVRQMSGETSTGTISVDVGTPGLTLYFSSKIEQRAPEGYHALSRYEADIPLTRSDGSAVYEGTASLRNVEHLISALENVPCTAQPGSGRMGVRVTLPEDGSAGSTEVVLVVDEAKVSSDLACEFGGMPGRIRQMATIWWPGFVIMHLGDYWGEGGLLVTDWERVDGPDMVARKVYNGSQTRESVTVSEETTIEIRRQSP
jgi:PKD repeat protein